MLQTCLVYFWSGTSLCTYGIPTLTMTIFYEDNGIANGRYSMSNNKSELLVASTAEQPGPLISLPATPTCILPTSLISMCVKAYNHGGI